MDARPISIPRNTHNMQTRANSGIIKPKTYASTITTPPNLLNSIPTSVSQAMQRPHWHQAMLKEFQALQNNKTWVLTSPPSNSKPIRCKWIFSIKWNPNGTIQKCKARLVAKGFNQREGLDFDQVFSPVIKHSTIRLILTIALFKGWKIRQFDFNNTFLNTNLIEEVYI